MTDEEKQAEQEQRARALASWIERLHWPQVFLFATFLVCTAALPIAFLTLVPEHTQQKVYDLPWSTILSVGLPMLGMALHGFLAPFMRPMVAKKEPDSKSPSTRPPAMATDPDPSQQTPLADEIGPETKP